MNTELIQLRAPKGTSQKIYKIVKNPRGKSRFILEAISEKLEAHKQIKFK